MQNWKIAAVVVVAASAAVLLAQVQRQGPGSSVDQVYSPAHRSASEAIRHFFGIRSEAAQPIAFVHRVHAEVAELNCEDCHTTAARGPQASIPDIRTCWTCHAEILPDHPEIKKLKAYRESGQDIPWQRVWGWPEEAHVRFNHEPHIRADVECAACHGDVAQMTIATRVLEHTMGFCLDCHKQRSVSNDCVTCHY